MSTNFYWLYDEPEPQFIRLPNGERIKCHDAEVPYDGTHVGKRYGCGNAETAFILCEEPIRLLNTLKHNIDHGHNQPIIQDEYGRSFNAKQFSILLHDNCRWELQSIGERFC